MRHRNFPGLPCVLIFAGVIAGCLLSAGKLSAASADYLVDDWGTENNLPSSTVTSIAQTPDGYLWVGTYNGLARFDGARFVTFDPVNTPELTRTRVQGLFLDARGTLWINTFRGGLTSYRDGVFRNEWPDQSMFDLHTTLAASSSNQVTFVTQLGEVLQRDPTEANSDWKRFPPPPDSSPIFQCTDGQGTLWFLTRDAHILQFANGAFKLLPDDGGLASSQIYTLVAGPRGQVWAGAENEVGRWNGAQFEAMTPTNSDTDIQPTLLFPARDGALWVLDGDRFRKMAGRAWVAEATQWRGLLGPASGRMMGAHEDRDGGLWFNHYGNGLFHITPDGKFQRFTSQESLLGDRVGAWFQGSDGGIWVGVDHGGLARLRDRRFHVIGPEEGLPARTALSICEDTNGTVWVGTAGGGLCSWSGGKIRRFAVGASAATDFIFSIAPRADGGLWLSAAEGEDLYQFLDHQVQRVSWDVHGVKSILTDRAGRVWMGTKNGIAFGTESIRWILGTNGTTTGTLPSVRALAQTPDGKVWAGADDGTIYHCEPDHVTPFRPHDALADQPVYSLWADADGTLWAGTFRGGLLRFKNGVFSRITDKQGLPVDVICQILGDHHGRLWLGTHQGIYCVAKSDLNAIADGGSNTLDYVAYGRHDGLPALECSDGYQPACWRGADGKLWFATVRGAVWLNPDELMAKSPPPPVVIEELRVDGETVPLRGQKITIAPGHKQFDFRFTALTFDAGDRARFRYQLAGFDSDWVNADTLRTAHYGPLPPNTYHFRVAACNSGGVWNDTGATLEFEVQPYFYQTLTFKLFAGATIIGGVAFAVRRVVTRKYRRQLALLEQQHAIERDRARIAKDIHDDIGAGLTQITLLTELARREPEQTGSNLERISDSARTLTKAMDEIVWAVDPQHDTLDGLMDYASAYAEDFLRVAGIRCRMDLPVTLPAIRVDAELRYNLFLALKEALNNIVKHSQATEVWLRLQLGPAGFTLSLEDNGRGLPADDRPARTGTAPDRLASGSGLDNMKQRLLDIGGHCEIHSEAGRGTRVELVVGNALKNDFAASPVVAIDQERKGD
jgi:signal transduction histidine kinase/ligand-binding sensor domain-containing protein